VVAAIRHGITPSPSPLSFALSSVHFYDTHTLAKATKHDGERAPLIYHGAEKKTLEKNDTQF